MPWQGHLFIGQKVHNYDEVRAIFKTLGKTNWTLDGEPYPYDDEALSNDEYDDIQQTIEYRGNKIEVAIRLRIEGEGGCDFPAEQDERDYTDAMVGFALTRRYRGAILDAGFEHGGRPEPFVFDPLEIQAILDQVRVWWPEAQALIWTIFH